MIHAKEIKLHRAEGLVEECITQHAKSFTEANGILSQWSKTAPKDMGYNKCDFVVTWEDGTTYTGCYDLVHWKREHPSLERHINEGLKFQAGMWCPTHIKDEEWNHVQKLYEEQGIRKRARDI